MKKGDLIDSEGGFTIIEVSLVIAIAGLIFLMVFIALPALQRSQRDTRRRDDVLSFLSNVKKYQTNNRGALPTGDSGTAQYRTTKGKGTTWQDFYDNYLGEGFKDPDGENYRLLIQSCGANAADSPCTASSLSQIYDSNFPYANYSIVVILQATCNGDQAIGSSNPRKLAALYRLEGSGTYCSNT